MVLERQRIEPLDRRQDRVDVLGDPGRGRSLVRPPATSSSIWAVNATASAIRTRSASGRSDSLVAKAAMAACSASGSIRGDMAMDLEAGDLAGIVRPRKAAASP